MCGSGGSSGSSDSSGGGGGGGFTLQLPTFNLPPMQPPMQPPTTAPSALSANPDSPDNSNSLHHASAALKVGSDGGCGSGSGSGSGQGNSRGSGGSSVVNPTTSVAVAVAATAAAGVAASLAGDAAGVVTTAPTPVLSSLSPSPLSTSAATTAGGGGATAGVAATAAAAVPPLPMLWAGARSATELATDPRTTTADPTLMASWLSQVPVYITNTYVCSLPVSQPARISVSESASKSVKKMQAANRSAKTSLQSTLARVESVLYGTHRLHCCSITSAVTCA
jgi:hypothetical protein